MAQQRAGKRKALLLTAGEAVAARAHHCVQTFRQRGDDLVHARGVKRRPHLFLTRIRLREEEVLPHRAVNQVGLLGDHANDLRALLRWNIAQVDPAQVHGAFGRIGKARKKCGHRGLAGPGMPH